MAHMCAFCALLPFSRSVRHLALACSGQWRLAGEPGVGDSLPGGWEVAARVQVSRQGKAGLASAALLEPSPDFEPDTFCGAQGAHGSHPYAQRAGTAGRITWTRKLSSAHMLFRPHTVCIYMSNPRACWLQVRFVAAAERARCQLEVPDVPPLLHDHAIYFHEPQRSKGAAGAQSGNTAALKRVALALGAKASAAGPRLSEKHPPMCTLGAACVPARHAWTCAAPRQG
jgi:hypothetical protein